MRFGFSFAFPSPRSPFPPSWIVSEHGCTNSWIRAAEEGDVGGRDIRGRRRAQDPPELDLSMPE